MHGPVITDDATNLFFNYKSNQFFKHFQFPVIEKSKIPTTPPNRYGLDFAVIDFECYHTYLKEGEYKKAELDLFAGGIHWNHAEYAPNYKSLKDDFIKAHMSSKTLKGKRALKEEAIQL
jgi:hypothetical protein